MPDVFTPAKRSAVMSRIRSRGNRDTEVALARLFRREGIRGWRRHLVVRSPKSEGRSSKEIRKAKSETRVRAGGIHPIRVRPDFVFPRLRLAVFVDGCFWHGCPIHATKPRTNAAFWRRKLAVNRAWDRRVNRALRAAGWRVLRVWEHELARKREARLVWRLRQIVGLPP